MTNKLFAVMLLSAFCWTGVVCQTTEFIFQGSLQSGGTSANGVFDFEFVLFGSAAGGTPIGAVNTRNGVPVTNGTFAANLDFGANFPGANRFLEIRVRQAGGGGFTTLSPRQPLTSAPYSVRSLSSASADLALTVANGGVNTGQIADNAVTNAKLAAGSVTASKIAPAQVVTSVNSFRDNVTLAAGANITITPFENTLTIAATGGGGGVGGSGTAATLPLWTAGTNLGNSLITQSGGEINMPSVVRFAPAVSGFQTNVGTPNSTTGITFSGPGARSDIRYDGTLTIVNGPGGVQGPANGITISTAGNIGIGTANAQTKLQLSGHASQDRSSGGFAKALLRVAANGTIESCYNGVTGASAGNCGFTVSAGSSGTYTVNLGFQVTDRFISVAARGINGPIGVPPTVMGADYRFSTSPGSDPNEVFIDTFRPDNGAMANNPFILIVF